MLSINSRRRPEVIPHCFPALLVPPEGLNLRKWVRNVLSLILRKKLSNFLKQADPSFYHRGIKRDDFQLWLKASYYLLWSCTDGHADDDRRDHQSCFLLCRLSRGFSASWFLLDRLIVLVSIRAQRFVLCLGKRKVKMQVDCDTHIINQTCFLQLQWQKCWQNNSLPVLLSLD